MYRFRKAGNFVQVEVEAPNNASETFKDDVCFCKAGNAVRFRAEAPIIMGNFVKNVRVGVRICHQTKQCRCRTLGVQLVVCET